MTHFESYIAALAKALGQELPPFEDGKMDFKADELSCHLRFDAETQRLFVFCVLDTLPVDAEARGRVYAELLHSQFCFCESSGFSFGVSHDDAYVQLQALFDLRQIQEADFVEQMDKFIRTADVWRHRLLTLPFHAADEGATALSGQPFGIQV